MEQTSTANLRRERLKKMLEERRLRQRKRRNKGIDRIQRAIDFPAAHDLSLQRLAMMSYVSAFWNTPNIQVELGILIENLREIANSLKSGYLQDYFQINEQEECIKEFFKKINEVLKKSVNLPRLLLNDLMHVNIFLGLRIIDWYEQLFREFMIDPLYFNSMRNLRLTCYGTLDEIKIIETECLKSEFLLMEQNAKILKDLEYYIACSCIQKNYLKQHSTEIIKTYQEYSASSNYKGYGLNIDYHFILCSAYFFEGRKGDLKKIIEKQGCYSIELYMFRLATRNCSEIAVRYYWQILNDCEELVKAALHMFKLMNGIYGSYLKILDCLVFLLTQMSETEKQDFFCQLMKNEYSNFSQPLITTMSWYYLNMVNFFEYLAAFPWPIETFFSPMFDIFKSKRADQLKDDKENYGTLLWTIYELLYKYQNLGFDVKKSEKYKRFFILFNEIQIRFNKDSSLIGHEENHFYTDQVKNLYKIFDIEILDAIINFACGKDYRRKALCVGNKCYKKLIAAEEYTKLNRFMEVVLISKDEREWFKGELLHFVPDFIMEDRFDIADKLLNWGFSSEEEKKLFKHGLDIMSICGKIYFEGGAVLSGKILKWFFPNDEDKAEYVSNFAFNKFWGLESKVPLPFIFVKCLKRQYKAVESIRPLYLVHPKFELLNIILAEGENSFIANAEKYLNWFFNSKEEVDEFKTRVLLNGCVFKNFLKNTFLFVHTVEHEKPKEFPFKLVEKYLKFCASSENYEPLKSKFFRDIDEWILYLSKNYVGVDQIDDFLDWVVKEVPSPRKYNLRSTENIVPIDKPLIIKNFLLSSHATEFFENLVRQHDVFLMSIHRFAGWIETLEGENKREIAIDLSTIESSLNYYHRQYCRINGKLEKELIPLGASVDGPIPVCSCACDFNIIHLNDVLKNKKNFKEPKFERMYHVASDSPRYNRDSRFRISKLQFSKRPSV